jgi:voltage-gated potassium channel Kch
VIIAGFGEFGATVGRMLRANGVKATVLDLDSDRVDLLRKLGMEVYYGDASRDDLLRSAGAEEAKLLVLALDSPEHTLELVRTARQHFPHLRILARAFAWDDGYELVTAGVEHVYRQSVDTAARAGTDALHLLGERAYTAQRAAQTFLHHDEESLHELARSRGDGNVYLSATRQRIEDLERIMLVDRGEPDRERDSGWDPESLREEARQLGGSPPSAGAMPATD